ncbi:hypothetical protein B0T16DRAFT_425878 [Cercophora newfieldiana]|uniref:Uncharacterized protein n=1 Tax=Cercophora newfieldiana TaxID=92897 RepID=A0AA39YTM2_9PEZI|nr:hypothetical protein B0T16DRAFT_425878 [Cercophora newfieldiana]
MRQATPSPFPDRFEIRKIESNDIPWVLAILAHSNLYCGPIWSVALPQEGRTERVYKFCRAMEGVIRHNVADNFSYGVWDTEYKFKRPESASTGGKLYWDESNLDATSEQLLEQMDFPLVSVAVAFDGLKKPDTSLYDPIIELIPIFGKLTQAMDAGDIRKPEERKPRLLGEMLFRFGTATRPDYAKHGLAKGLGHWLLKEAARHRFLGMQIGVAHAALEKVFMNPPAPFTAKIVSDVNLAEFEVEEDGVKVKPCAACGDVPFKKIYVSFG